MDERQALLTFAALSQETRLRILRMLVVAGPEGLAAGAIAEKSEASPSNVSFHLKELEHAGLTKSRRDSRTIFHSVEYHALSDVIRFLMDDCCGGHPEICSPILSATACCAPAKEISE